MGKQNVAAVSIGGKTFKSGPGASLRSGPPTFPGEGTITKAWYEQAPGFRKTLRLSLCGPDGSPWETAISLDVPEGSEPDPASLVGTKMSLESDDTPAEMAAAAAVYNAAGEKLLADYWTMVRETLGNAPVFASAEAFRVHRYDFFHAACNAAHADGKAPDATRYSVAHRQLERTLPVPFYADEDNRGLQEARAPFPVTFDDQGRAQLPRASRS